MNPKEQEIAIGELEERVDRLRNIYEQYFLGFEKLEPTVPKKDVDRRFAILRKEQIRNTAMRFRFQVVTQKYNTYAIHWVRICRQIEEGTYKRHVRKAKARFGDTSGGIDRDVSIDIDMGDFDDVDVDALLAEADASAAKYGSDTSDTVPPAAPEPRTAPMRPIMTPGTSFPLGGAIGGAMGSRREVLDEREPNTPPPSVRALADRAPRGAALPPGAKPRILRKRDDTEPPPSGRALAAPPSTPVIPGPPSNPRMPAGAAGAAGSIPRMPAPSSAQLPPGSSPRMPAPSRPQLDIPGGRPSGPRIVRSGTAPESAPGLSSATPHAGAPAAGRIPVAAPSGGTPGPSSGGGAPSGGRIPAAAPPAPAPSAGRIPIPPPRAPGAPSAPGMPARPPLSVPRLPPTTLPRPGAAGAPSAGAQGARPQAPSVPERESAPPSGDARPSVRPRAPLPLPSQIARRPDTKKE
ncbi:MAG: hypothetical protein JWP87_5771 [Labilithrix sp.]|nr:hypothetical protein [Labilithrix sp.]